MVASMFYELKPGVILGSATFAWALELHFFDSLFRILFPRLRHCVFNGPVLLLLVGMVAEHVNLENHGRWKPGSTVVATHMLARGVGVVNLLPVPFQVERVRELLPTIGTGVALVPFVERQVSCKASLAFKLSATNITGVIWQTAALMRFFGDVFASHVNSKAASVLVPVNVLLWSTGPFFPRGNCNWYF